MKVLKNLKDKIINNKKYILGIITGILISGTTVYAATVISAANVSYSNTTSSLSSTNVQEAIDELYNKANLQKNKNNKIYFDLYEPTTSSSTDYKTLNENLFVALNGMQKSVCIIKNDLLNCFDINNAKIEKEHLKTLYSNTDCTTLSYEDCLYCSDSSFECKVYDDGKVKCFDKSSWWEITIDKTGNVSRRLVM